MSDIEVSLAFQESNIGFMPVLKVNINTTLCVADAMDVNYLTLKGNGAKDEDGKFAMTWPFARAMDKLRREAIAEIDSFLSCLSAVSRGDLKAAPEMAHCDRTADDYAGWKAQQEQEAKLATAQKIVEPPSS